MIRYIITGISKEGVRGNIFSNNKTYPTLKGVKRALLTYEECFTPDVELRYEEIEIETELEVARKEITSLKAQLKREMAAVDFYANISNWNGEDSTGWNHTHIICTEDQEEKVVGVWGNGANYPEEDEYDNVGGKLARETVKVRE